MRFLSKPLLILVVIAFFGISPIPAKAQAVKGTYLYSLSDFTGAIPYNWARVSVDKDRSEVYVLYQNSLRIFNEAGMEIHRFGDDLNFGHIVDMAIEPSGDILLLAFKESGREIIRCNYRGVPKSNLPLRDLPDEYRKFVPNRMVYRDGDLYFISSSEMRIVITDHQGHFKKGYDLIRLLDREERDRGNMDVVGFDVDQAGNILFTVPSMFKAYILSPEGKIDFFGRPGSVGGKFNIVAGITRDSKGNYLVVDKLKCAVMVFDKEYKFLTQFGFRGLKPGNLIAPDDITIDRNDKIYITQSRKRGVSVYHLTHQ